MVLGIVGLVLICVWFVSLPCAIVGLCLSVVGKSRSKVTNTGGGMAITGIVLSCVTLVLLVAVFVMFLTGMSMMGDALRNLPRRR
jgi:ABC-type Na+ efflux pump permease subunit